MNKALFSRLIEELCKLNDIADASSVIHGTPIAISEVVFSLVYREEVNANCLLMYCDFGPLPKERETEAMLELLTTNVYLYTGRGPSFAFSRERGHVLLIDHYPLELLDAESLHQILSCKADQALEWRKTHFIEKSAQSIVTTTEQTQPYFANESLFEELSGKL